MCMTVLPMCKYVYHAWYVRPEKDIGSPRSGVINGYELPCEYWKLNPCLLQEQQVFLTTEPAL